MYPLTQPQDLSSAWAIVLAAALLHASFQLAVSVMTLLSGHALGQQRSHRRLIQLCSTYLAGNAAAVISLLFVATYILSVIPRPASWLWLALTIFGVASGLSALLFYYRDNGSRLWLPTKAADYLFERSKRTRRDFEAFGLGMLTTIAELPFIAAPLLFVAMMLRGEPGLNHLGVGVGYTTLACLPLLVLFLLVGSGKRTSTLELWRANNRRFLQLISGCGLLIISLYAFSLFGLGGQEVGLW